MSYELCTYPQAKKPYYIENIRTGIYSVEELCYYLYNNACLIDETLINEKLIDWLRDEFGMTRLYRQLYEQLERKEGTAFFVLPIFRETGYLNAKQMREYQEQLAQLELQAPEARQKMRGDYLVREGMYGRAAWEYRRILEGRAMGRLGGQFYAAVWNNLGAAYAAMFRYESAAECFLEAYRIVKTKETFRKYISTLPLYLSEEAYQKRLKELRADPELVRSIQEYNVKVCGQQEFLNRKEQMQARDPQEVLKEWKDRFERSTKI